MRLALTHRSFLHNNGGAERESNERLEYLGDSVLGLVCSEWLYRNRPHEHEGQLTKTKSLLVSKAILSRRALAMGLGRFVLLSNSEVESGGRQRLSILADAFEAVIGAIYLDQGLDAAREFITTWLLNEANGIIADKRHTNYKSLLQEYVQSTYHTHPVYRIRSETGPDHQKVFTVDVLVGSRNLGEGRGQNKKEAEQDAARDALDRVAAKSAPRRGSGRADRGERGRGSRGRGGGDRARGAEQEPSGRRGSRRAPRERGERPEAADRGERPKRPARAERASRSEGAERAERSRPARGAGRSTSTERKKPEERRSRGRRAERSPARFADQKPTVGVEKQSAATGSSSPGRSGPEPERGKPAERRVARAPEPAPVEKTEVAASGRQAPASSRDPAPVYGRSGKRATRGLHSEAARAELEAAKPPEEPSRATAESPVSTPQRHGSLKHDTQRDFRPPEVEIVRQSGPAPPGAPSDRYRAAESGGPEEPSSRAHRERVPDPVDSDEGSEP